MTFNDIFKSSFLENITSVRILDMAIALVLAFGSFSGSDASSVVNAPIDTPVSGGMSDRPMISWIFDSEEYTELYHKLFSEFINSVDLGKLIDDTAAMIDSYVQKDPTKFCTYEEYQKGVAAIRSFCTLRAESVKGQLDGTIPSTSDGQSADSSALIDTGDIVISDMGSMNNGSGDNKGGFGGFSSGSDKDKTVPSDDQGDTEQAAAASSDAVGNMSMSFDPSQFGGNMPDVFGAPNVQADETQASEDNTGSSSAEQSDTAETTEKPAETKLSDKAGDRSQSGNFPQMNGSSHSDDNSGVILLGVSALCLIAGIVFAAVYRR